MTKQGFTDIALIVDRSGSMASIRTDMEGALNTFLEDQKKVEGECTVSFFQFDDQYQAVFEHVDVQHAPRVSIYPRNSTALYDAVGRTINTLGENYRKMNEDERPEKVIVVIVTDGMENASTEFTGEQVKDMIKHQEDSYGWAFTYIGANQDAYAVGHGLGMAKGSAMNFGANFHGTQAVAQSLSSAVTRTRVAGGPANQSYGYTQEEQDAGDATVQ